MVIPGRGEVGLVCRILPPLLHRCMFPGLGAPDRSIPRTHVLTGSQRAVSISLAEVKQRLSLRFGMVASRKLEWGTLVCTV